MTTLFVQQIEQFNDVTRFTIDQQLIQGAIELRGTEVEEQEVYYENRPNITADEKDLMYHITDEVYAAEPSDFIARLNNSGGFVVEGEEYVWIVTKKLL